MSASISTMTPARKANRKQPAYLNYDNLGEHFKVPKECKHCKMVKDWKEFPTVNKGTTLHSYCLSCRRSQNSWSITHKLKQHKYNAKKRGYEITISDDRCLKLFSMDCDYCGKKAIPNHCYNGIDRVVSSIGYTYENSVPCCKICNRLKGSLEFDEWIQHLNRILNHQKAKTEE